jgi:hypothetical protein
LANILLTFCAVQLIFPVVVMAAIPWCVESPRWLASKGRNDQVYEVLARLRGNGVTATSEEILQAGGIIISTAEHEAAVESSWKAVRRKLFNTTIV